MSPNGLEWMVAIAVGVISLAAMAILILILEWALG